MLAALEKIFVFFVVITGMFLLFLFGLYFDVGEMFVAIIGQEEQRPGGGVETELVDWASGGRKGPKGPGDLVSEGEGTNDSIQLSESEKAFVFGSTKLSAADRMKIRAEELKAKGFTSQAFIDMESLGVNLDEYNTTMKGVNELLGLNQMAEAAQLLEDKIKAENPDNLLVLREYYTVLVRLHYEMNDLDKAYAASNRLTEILDKIITIRKVALKDVMSLEVEQTIPTLEAEKALLDEVYRTTKPRIEQTGSAHGLLEEEKAQMRQMLDDALRSGELKQEDHEKALKELGL